MTDLSLQEQVAIWHRTRFPNSQSGHIALKAVSELGEVADALLGEDPLVSCGYDGNVVEKCADVVIAMLALVGRFYPACDLLDVARVKLSLLNDVESDHRSSLGAL